MPPKGPKEPTRAQLNSKLAYHSQTPSFLLKFQNKMKGIDNDDEYDEEDEFEDDGSGRPPIPRRPAIPERPQDDPGSAGEEDGDELPQVVVLREGKHLSAREVENIKRAEKGLAPLPELKEHASGDEDDAQAGTSASTSNKTSEKPKAVPAAQSLSFSSSTKLGSTGAAAYANKNKRKAMAALEDLIKEGRDEEDTQAGGTKKGAKKDKEKKGLGKSTTKKAKKESKTLLSFGDET